MLSGILGGVLDDYECELIENDALVPKHESPSPQEPLAYSESSILHRDLHDVVAKVNHQLGPPQPKRWKQFTYHVGLATTYQLQLGEASIYSWRFIILPRVCPNVDNINSGLVLKNHQGVYPFLTKEFEVEALAEESL
ncbi:hypothetical protein JHK87_052933 [Glycine soja]|nr:hypothetical protein JHK87_052933 [Glycine soja]